MLLQPDLPAVLLFQLACLLTMVCAATNVSIDDQDPLFYYSRNWTRILDPAKDKDGGHMVTSSPDAFANITYTFATVYFLSPLWPYKVTTNYGIDGNIPLKIDLQDHSVPPVTGGGLPIIASGVVGQWTSNVNQQHTIHITVPKGNQYAIVDMFIFEVLDASDIPSSITSTSSSTGTTSTASSSTASPSSFHESQVSLSSTRIRDLAIPLAIVGTLFILFLLWLCIRRKNGIKNGKNTNPTTTHDFSVPSQDNNSGLFTTSMSECPMLTTKSDPLIVSPASIRSDDTSSHCEDIQSDYLQRPPNYTSLHSDLPSRLVANGAALSSLPLRRPLPRRPLPLPRPLQPQPQPRPLPLPPTASLRAEKSPRDPQGRHFTPSMITDSPPMYKHDSNMSLFIRQVNRQVNLILDGFTKEA